MRAALPAAAGSSLRAGLAHHAAQVGLADRRLARLVLLRLLGELLLLGLLGGALALGLEPLGFGALGVFALRVLALAQLGLARRLGALGFLAAACSRAARSIAICASARGGGAGSGLTTGGAGFGSTTGGAGLGSGGVGARRGGLRQRRPELGDDALGLARLPVDAEGQGDDQEDVREDRQREPRAHAGRLLRREHVALEDGGVHRRAGALRLIRRAGS